MFCTSSLLLHRHENTVSERNAASHTSGLRNKKTKVTVQNPVYDW